MSSPLCSLDKKKKSPSNPSKNFGKRSMPFRNAEYTKEQEMLNDIEHRMTSYNTYSKSESPSSSTKSSVDYSLDGLTSQMLMAPVNSRLSPMLHPLGQVSKPRSTKETSPNDMELISVMMKRITQLEKQTSYYSKEVVEKTRRIKVLEEKLSLLSKAQELRQTQDPTRVEQLESKCHQLQQQIYEMETFLADYGMVWVGEESDPFSENYLENENNSLPIASVTTAQPQPNLVVGSTSDFTVDYDLILRNIHDLNIIAGEGESKVEKTKDGARLKVKESVPLTLFANGILMFNGPFRSYNDVTTKRCLRDMMDGFFPTELQKQYPEGVPIMVTDKRSIIFKDPRLSRSFPGVGRILQDEAADDDDVTSGRAPASSTSLQHVSSATANESKHTQVEGYEVVTELPGKRLSVEQFLQNLPKSVIRDGKVVGIRSSLKDQLTADSAQATTNDNSTEIVETNTVQEMQERMSIPPETRPISARNVTTIRVKCENGTKTYILKMKFTDTVGDLRQYIDRQRPRYKKPYEIMSTFPKQVHSSNDKTLEESGLIPNATLHLKPKK